MFSCTLWKVKKKCITLKKESLSLSVSSLLYRLSVSEQKCKFNFLQTLVSGQWRARFSTGWINPNLFKCSRDALLKHLCICDGLFIVHVTVKVSSVFFYGDVCTALQLNTVLGLRDYRHRASNILQSKTNIYVIFTSDFNSQHFHRQAI